MLANGQIENNGVFFDPLTSPPPFAGLAGSDPVTYVHSGTSRLPMPNLQDFSYYKSKAITEGGKLFVGTELLVDEPGLFLEGSIANPIIVSGPVVIPGDVIVKGRVSGRGTLYVGGNLYIAGDIEYVNGPDFSTPPTTMPVATRDAWVQASTNRDLVAFAVRESVLGGDVNSSDWKANCYNAAQYGLKNVGNEKTLGEDGIAHTPDDGILYRDTNGDGTSDSAWYDADEDGLEDASYNYSTQIEMNTSRIGQVDKYPTDVVTGQPLSYSSVASISMNLLNGVYYTNHAMAMYMNKANSVINGAVICRDEAIIFNSSLKIRYDSRIHSRYSDDPNRHIDLGLPIDNKVAI